MLSANSEDPNQTPRYAVSDLGLHYLPMWTRGLDISASLFCIFFCCLLIFVLKIEDFKVFVHENHYSIKRRPDVDLDLNFLQRFQ